jgi:hypothetical protein
MSQQRTVTLLTGVACALAGVAVGRVSYYLTPSSSPSSSSFPFSTSPSSVLCPVDQSTADATVARSGADSRDEGETANGMTTTEAVLKYVAPFGLPVTQYVIAKAGYVVGYDPRTRTARYVLEHLTRESVR